jgi:multidrug efflux pump subunit AcrA (membrane-fusion protein)
VAIQRINGQFFVFVAETTPQGTVAHQRQIVVGSVVGNNYIVQSGLKAGEQLIVAGIQKIGDGAPVHVMPAGRGAAPAPGEKK